ncbi:MAG: hypothetical protein NZ108_05790, partial [Bacteroidia bacterium]|nr:hypothetical protein [Bacteroidia bacterium]
MVGQTFSRNIVIRNSGNGRLSSFTLDDTIASGITVTAMTPGTFSLSGGIARVVLSGAQFTSIGNNDAFFDPNEQITITETINILACTNLTSRYAAYWGCNSAICKNVTQNGNVTILPGVPNLINTHSTTLTTCYNGGATQMFVRLRNAGSGPARNVWVEIFNATGNTYNNSMYQKLDTASITVQTNTGAITNLDPDSVTNTTVTGNFSCLAGASPIGRFYVTIPLINPGDSVTIRWDAYSCCPDFCPGASSSLGATWGWNYSARYFSQCLNQTYTIGNTKGRNYDEMRLTSQEVSGPADLNNGQSGNYRLTNNGVAFWSGAPTGTRRMVEVEVILPDGINWTGTPGFNMSTPNFRFAGPSGVGTWGERFIRYSVVPGATPDTLVGRYRLNAPITLEKSEIQLTLVGACGTNGIKNVVVNTYYLPDTNCATCRIKIRCTTIPIRLHCPTPCPTGGAYPFSYTIQRVSYGLPDNDDDGLADGTGSLDFTKIRTDRVMYGDTIESTIRATILSGTGGSTWNFLFWENIFPNGADVNGSANLQVVSSTVNIKDMSAGGIIRTCTNLPVFITNSGSQRNFRFHVFADTLIARGCVPAGWRYENGDSVTITVRYRVNRNIGNALTPNTVTNDLYTQTTGTPGGTKYKCDEYSGYLTLIGYGFVTWGPNTFTHTACDTVTLQQTYYLSIGPCCSNYAGGNLFPFEYRQWTYLNQLKVTRPTGYSFASGRFNQQRTAGTNLTNTSAWVNITPVDPNANPLVFNLNSAYTPFGGVIPLSDDGFNGNYEIRLVPSCASISGSNMNIVYTQKYDMTGR